MKNRILLSMAVCAVMIGGSIAFGASIDAMGVPPDNVPPSGGGYYGCNASYAFGLSPDGQVAVGYTYGNLSWDGQPYQTGEHHIPVYWSKPTGIVPRNSTWRWGDWTGIGTTSGGTPGPNYGATVAGNICGIGKYLSPTIGLDTYTPDTTKNLPPTSETLAAGTNSVAGNGQWIAGTYVKAGQAYSDHAMRWDAANVNSPVYRQGSGTTAFRGVSNGGACVGQDRHGVAPGGATGQDGAIYWDGTGGTGVGVTDIPALAGNVATKGQGAGISDNGSYATGYMYTDSGTPLYVGFRWSPGDASSMALLPVAGDTLAWGGDVSDGGAVAGWTYNSTDSYRACLWDASGNPQLLWDVLVSAGVDMSGWQKLTRAYSITPDGLYISGYGTTAAGREEGFVAMIPEPASLLLLALGGLALYRRR